MQQRGWYDVISEEQLQEKVLARLDLSREIGDDELTELIFQVLDEESDGGIFRLRKRRNWAGTCTMHSAGWICSRI